MYEATKIYKELINKCYYNDRARGLQFLLAVTADDLVILAQERRPKGNWVDLSWHPIKDDADAIRHIAFTLYLFSDNC